MKRKFNIICAAAATAVLLIGTFSGCSGNNSASNSSSAAGDKKPVSITMAQSKQPPSLDPHEASGDAGGNVFNNITEMLTTYSSNETDIIPSLADSWEQVSENEWVFKLKPNIKFSNGEPFNSAAVGYNLDRAASTEVPRQTLDYRPYFDSWEAIDDLTIKIKTKVPAILMPNYMSELPMLAPKHSEDVGEDGVNTNPIGTGPFILKEWVPDQKIILVKNDNYWGGKVPIDEFTIVFIPEASTQVAELIGGRVDLVIDVNYENIGMVSTDKTHIVSELTRRTPFIGFNTLDWSPNPQLKDPKVRLAINYAIDQKSIVDNILGGYGETMNTFWRKDFPAYDASLGGLDYNPEKAKALLKEAGYENGFDIKIQASSGTIIKAAEIAQAVAANLKAVGINCEVELLDYSMMRSIIISGQEQKKVAGLYLWSWAGKPVIYNSHLTGVLNTKGGSSFNGITEYDVVIDKILNAKSNSETNELLAELQKLMLENPAMGYLHQQGVLYGVSNRIDWDPNNFYGIKAIHMSVKE